MQRPWLLLVSTLLTYNDIGATPGSEEDCAELSKRRTVLEPYMSQYDYLYENKGNETNENKGRSFLTAKVVKSFTAPFTQESWDNIERLTPVPFMKKEVEKNVDNKGNVNDLYSYVTNLLMLKINDYVETRDNIEFYESYLGYNSQTEELINFAITELTYQARKGIIDVRFLLEMFYLSCDVRSVVMGSFYNRPLHMLQQFEKLVNSIGEEKMEAYKKNGEENCKQFIIDYFETIVENPDPSIAVSISAMKMKIFIEPATDELINGIKNLPASFFGEKTVEEYVRSYAEETQDIKINAYHSMILGFLVMHVFGYVFEFFNLLRALQKFEIKQEYHDTIKLYQTFMDPYMAIFVDRYFEFRGEINQELVDAMFEIKFFLNPSDTTRISDRIQLSETEVKALNKRTTPDVSLLSYFDRSFKSDTFKKEMEKIIFHAVDIVAKTFYGDEEDDCESLVGEWIHWNIVTNNVPKNESKLVDLIRKNYVKATSILRTFSFEFSVGYKAKYDKNLRSSEEPDTDMDDIDDVDDM